MESRVLANQIEKLQLEKEKALKREAEKEESERLHEKESADLAAKCKKEMIQDLKNRIAEKSKGKKKTSIVCQNCLKPNPRKNTAKTSRGWETGYTINFLFVMLNEDPEGNLDCPLCDSHFPAELVFK